MRIHRQTQTAKLSPLLKTSPLPPQSCWRTGCQYAVMAAVLLLLAACLPEGVSWRAGWGSRQVRVVISDEEGGQLSYALGVAYKYHHTFIRLDGAEEGGEENLAQKVGQDDGRPLRRISAQVLRPDANGVMVISMPPDVVELEMLFMAPRRLTKVLRLRHQLGLGDIFYQAQLQSMSDWRSHYYTYLVPRLQPLLTEEGYGLSPRSQQLLGEWLSDRQQVLEAGR